MNCLNRRFSAHLVDILPGISFEKFSFNMCAGRKLVFISMGQILENMDDNGLVFGLHPLSILIVFGDCQADTMSNVIWKAVSPSD